MARSTAWKDHEKSAVKSFGGVRLGATGKATADVVTPVFSIECKESKKLPLWLKDAVKQAVKAAKPTQLPIVIFHELHSHRANDIVCIRRSDFESWYGQTGKAEDCDDN